MKFFAKNNFLKKIVVIFVLLTSFNFAEPKPVQAEDPSFGGELLGPISSFFVALADGVNALIHKVFLGSEDVLFEISSGAVWWKVIIGVVIAIGLIAATIATAGSISIFTTALLAGASIFTVGAVTVTMGATGTGVTYQISSYLSKSMMSSDSMYLPAYSLTPYEIFSNQQDIFSVNFFEDVQETDTMLGSLKKVVADWYKTIRMIAVVGMMSVLVYIGIRIVLSSVAESKAKYKQMLADWVIAMILLFVMHYIMVFANLFVDKITDMIKLATNEGMYQEEGSIGEKTFVVNKDGVECFIIGAATNDKGEMAYDEDTKELVEDAWKTLVGDGAEENEEYKPLFAKADGMTQATSAEDAAILVWPADNFEVQARIKAQLEKKENGTSSYSYVGYNVIYVMLVVYTCIFIFVYIRRLIYMAFLTLISPLVALTYPIDKVKDGQAQAFNFWLREYVYNLLLQPLHLLLYMILIGSAMAFASSNPIYVVVCLGFMVPAEKLLKQMFGFKGTTPGSMPGIAAGALMMNGMRSLFGKRPPGGKSDGGKDKSSSNEDNTNVKTKSVEDPYGNPELFGESGGSTGAQDTSTTPRMNSGDSEGAQDVSTTPRTYTDEIESGDFDETQGTSATPLNESAEDAFDAQSGNTGGGRATAMPAMSDTNANNSNVRSNKNKGRRIKRFMKGTGNVLKNNGANLLKTLPKQTLRLAKGAVGAGIGIAAGGIAGIATGDVSKAFEYMTVGGAAGGKAFSRLGEGAFSGIKKNYQIGKYAGDPEALREAKMKAQKKAFNKNKENDAVLKANLTSEQYKTLNGYGLSEDTDKRLKEVVAGAEYSKIFEDKEISEQLDRKLRTNLTEQQYNEVMKRQGEGTVLDSYLERGYTDVKDIIASEKFMTQQHVSRDTAMSALKLYKDNGRNENVSKDSREIMQRKFAQQGVNSEVAMNKAENYIRSMHKIQKNILT